MNKTLQAHHDDDHDGAITFGQMQQYRYIIQCTGAHGGQRNEIGEVADQIQKEVPVLQYWYQVAEQAVAGGYAIAITFFVDEEGRKYQE